MLALLLAPLPAAAMLDCKHIRVDDVSFNLEALGGPHSVVTSQWHPPTYTNTSYTVDICAPLKRKGDVKKEEQCPSFTRGMDLREIVGRLRSGKLAQNIANVSIQYVPLNATSIQATTRRTRSRK